MTWKPDNRPARLIVTQHRVGERDRRLHNLEYRTVEAAKSRRADMILRVTGDLPYIMRDRVTVTIDHFTTRTYEIVVTGEGSQA